MSWLRPAIRIVTVTTLLLASLLGGLARQQVVAQGSEITITVTALTIISPDGASAYPVGYTYTQAGVRDGVTANPEPDQTILVFHTEGAIAGQGVTGPDGTVTLTVRGGYDYFILNAADSNGYSASTDGTVDASWIAIYNGYRTAPTAETGGEPTTAPTVPAAAPSNTGTGENPASAEPTATTATGTDSSNDTSADASADDSADSGADSSSDASADSSTDASADPSAAPGSAGTGSPAAIYAGTCDTADLTADPVAVLSETTAHDGETQGADDASAVETSVTTLDLPLDDILAADHVLVVFDENDDSVALACGAIGGIVTDDGTLAFGLPAVGESRFSGVATLTEDGDQTEATILLAGDLSPAASPPA